MLGQHRAGGRSASSIRRRTSRSISCAVSAEPEIGDAGQKPSTQATALVVSAFKPYLPVLGPFWNDFNRAYRSMTIEKRWLEPSEEDRQSGLNPT